MLLRSRRRGWAQKSVHHDHTLSDKLQFAVTLGLGIALGLLSVRRGPILERYGAWNRLLV